MAAVVITRDEHTPAALRREAVGYRDSNAAWRMLAVALVNKGHPRAEAGRLFGVELRGSPGTGRCCATGFTVTTRTGLRACRTSRVAPRAIQF